MVGLVALATMVLIELFLDLAADNLGEHGNASLTVELASWLKQVYECS